MDNNLLEPTTTNGNMVSDYGDNKASKEKELNASMSIQSQSADEYTNKIHNIGGNN